MLLNAILASTTATGLVRRVPCPLGRVRGYQVRGYQSSPIVAEYPVPLAGYEGTRRRSGPVIKGGGKNERT